MIYLFKQPIIIKAKQKKIEGDLKLIFYLEKVFVKEKENRRIKSLWKEFFFIYIIISLILCTKNSCCNFDMSNFIDVYEHNYSRDFDKRDLIYLSADAKDEIEYFDPTKTYIIGSIIDEGTPKFKFASITTARREGIRVQKLPLDRYIRYDISVFFFFKLRKP